MLPSGRAYIVMELLEGKSLLGRMVHDRAFGSDERLALSLTGEIASALEAAHRKHIVHRDLKPDNIFLVEDQRALHGFVVKILDFGIAKLLSTEGEGQAGIARTRTGALLGTPIYMSPEQCRGAVAVDWRADIYAMGCILFEMLAGRPPFTYEGFGELISAHIAEPPPELLALQPRLTPAIAAFVARLLEKDPARRPQSMEAAGKEIAALLAQVVATSEMRARETEPMPAAGQPPPVRPSQPPIDGAGERPVTGPGHTLVADAVGAIDVRDSLGPPRPLVEKSRTTLSEMAAEGLHGRRPQRRGRGAVWASLAVIGVAGAAAGLFAYLRTDVAPPPPPSARVAAVPPQPARAPAVASAPRTVRVQIGDAPPELTAPVDGHPASLPLVLPAGPAVHSVVFRAPGYGDRNIVVDGTADRTLTLGMGRLPAPEPGPAATDRPAPNRPSRAATSGGSAASRRHRRADPSEAPPPLELDDDERKL
jgi:serine/threonine-protein kinase